MTLKNGKDFRELFESKWLNTKAEDAWYTYQLVRLKFERDYNRIKLLKLKMKVIGISDKYDITKRYPALH